MKKLTCEMCGSTDLIKSEGVFVCQSCGLKYTIEEARKLMIEGTVSVTVDNSNMVEQWTNMAENAINSRNYAEAYQYYTKIVEEQPNNWKAIWGKGKSAAWQSTLANTRSAELYQAVNKVIEIINEELAIEEQADIRKELCLELVDFNNAITNLYEEDIPKDLEDMYPSWDEKLYIPSHKTMLENVLKRHVINAKKLKEALTLIEDYQEQFSEEILEVKKMACENIRRAFRDFSCYHDYSSDSWHEYVSLSEDTIDEFLGESYRLFYAEYLYDIRQVEPSFAKEPHLLPRVMYEGKENVEFWDKMYNIHADYVHKVALIEYWSKHPEEKEALEDKIAEVKQKLSPLKTKQNTLNNQKNIINAKKGSRLPAENTLDSIKNKIKTLMTEFNSLGIFSGKRKKAIQSELDNLNIEKANAEKQLKIEQEQREKEIREQIAKIDEEIMPINREIITLEKELADLENELNKAR